jgi:hypothetical protein
LSEVSSFKFLVSNSKQEIEQHIPRGLKPDHFVRSIYGTTEEAAEKSFAPVPRGLKSARHLKNTGLAA